MKKILRKARKPSTVLITISLILFTYSTWVEYQELYSEIIRPVEISNVERLKKCRDPEYGCSVYKCPNCGETKYVGFSCKSRLCTSCGNRAIRDWSEKVQSKLLNVGHRHIVLTVPERLWPILAKNPVYQKAMMDAAKVTIEDMIRYSSTKKRKLKIGLIQVLQTYGSDMKTNIHLHGIMAEGGLDKNGCWINIRFINYNSWRRKWQYEVLTRLKKCMPKGKETNELIDGLFKQYTNGFVIHAKTRFKKNRALQFVRYIGRYVRHPPISESRIISYDKTYVRFWYRKSGSKKKVFVKLNKIEFIHRLLSHIPERNFKIVRCYGIYARRAKKIEQLEFIIHSEDNNLPLEKFTWRAWIIKSFGRDPVLCKRCGFEMFLDEICYYGFDCTNDRPPPSSDDESSTSTKELCQQEKMQIIVFTMKEIECEKGSDIKELIEKCREKGINDNYVKHAIDNLMGRGEACKFVEGKVKYLRW